MAANYEPFVRFLAELSFSELETIASDYIWMAEFGPLRGRYNYTVKRDQIVVECERRGRPDVIRRIREHWSGLSIAQRAT